MHWQGFFEHLPPQQVVSVVIVAHASAPVLTSAGFSCRPFMPQNVEINHDCRCLAGVCEHGGLRPPSVDGQIGPATIAARDFA